ncbi:MAG: HAMP domain-containing sensor histidine kinase [Polyangiaceae bacterium]
MKSGADLEVAAGLAALVLHDLRNLLATIDTSASIVSSELAPTRADRDLELMRRHAARASTVARRAQDLCSRALAVSRGERLERASTIARVVFERAIDAIALPAGVTLVVREPADVALSAELDLLARAVGNLIENAVDALRERGGSIELAARVSEDGVVLTIRDDGPGLPDGVAFAGVTTKPGGSGLGMRIARAIAVAHGGSLAVAETGPRGTVLSLALPA